MDTLELFKSPHEKKRIGKPNDGGYVICNLPGNYDCLISGGISNDISFEQAFLNIHPGIPCFAFDGTIDKLPENDARIQFIKKNLGAAENEYMSNLKKYMDSYENIFMKIDIEGHEFRLLPQLVGEYMSKVKQLVLEIHTPGDIELHPDYFIGLSDITNQHMFELLKEINKTHTLVHVHPNNGCKTYILDGIMLPNVFECTYIRNDYIPGGIANRERNNEPLPTKYDMRNVVKLPELYFSGYPWCL